MLKRRRFFVPIGSKKYEGLIWQLRFKEGFNDAVLVFNKVFLLSKERRKMNWQFEEGLNWILAPKNYLKFLRISVLANSICFNEKYCRKYFVENWLVFLTWSLYVVVYWVCDVPKKKKVFCLGLNFLTI